jgi:signal transduction histidine kinase
MDHSGSTSRELRTDPTFPAVRDAAPPLNDPTDAPPAPKPIPRLLPLFRRRRTVGGILSSLRIRKKLFFLHTVFSLTLAAILLVSIRPALNDVVYRAELDEARTMLAVLERAVRSDGRSFSSSVSIESLLPTSLSPGRRLQFGEADDLGLSIDDAARATINEGAPVEINPAEDVPRAAIFLPGMAGGSFLVAEVRIDEARGAVFRLYILLTLALLAVYVLVAAALELLVLPRNVYDPIRRLLDADRAVRDGRREDELIAPRFIPADELGEIMRSRNDSIVALREHQHRLGEALRGLAESANDLKVKNHLLENARRNLADADRLASLGMMSAGIAHELNTPLAVLKGLVERLANDPRRGTDPATAALMVRVVGRLERLGESLLDFARVRPPRTAPTEVRSVVDEALTLVRLDRDASRVRIMDAVPVGVVVECDADRLVQVLVNLIRNSVDALSTAATSNDGASGARGLAEMSIRIEADTSIREGEPWVSIRITDSGPGIDPAIMPRLFEPFASSRLDARGTGLGLAVADGIVREHGGLILARNRADASGAIFEIMMPRHAPPPDHARTSDHSPADGSPSGVTREITAGDRP